MVIKIALHTKFLPSLLNILCIVFGRFFYSHSYTSLSRTLAKTLLGKSLAKCETKKCLK